MIEMTLCEKCEERLEIVRASFVTSHGLVEVETELCWNCVEAGSVKIDGFDIVSTINDY